MPENQISSDHIDFTFRSLSSELGCVEINLVDHGPKGKDEPLESAIKTPKIMRNFCSQIVNQHNVQPQDIKIVSFTISGSYLIAGIMTFTKDSTALLYTSPRLKMPDNIEEVPRLLPPVLTLVYNCSQVMMQTADLIKAADSSGNLVTKYFFPSSFVSGGADVSHKKRKTSQ